MSERPNLGFGGELDQFDPAEWGRGPMSPRPSATASRRAADASGFHSREPVAPSIVAEPAELPKRQPRRRRTGRNVQFNIKARPETIEAFCMVADLNDWGLGETLEHAVSLLQIHCGGRARHD